MEQVRNRAWFVRLYGDNARALARGLSTVEAHKPCYLTCTMISSTDLAHYGVSRAKAWVSVDHGTSLYVAVQPLCSVKFIPDGVNPLLHLQNLKHNRVSLGL